MGCCMAGNLCEHCTGLCCQYIALPIDTPKTPGDFDDIRWYLIHENVSVFVEEGEWYILFRTPCRHLLPDHRCGIYATRPRVCRKYGTDECDYHSGDYGWEHHFSAPEHLDEYLRMRNRNGQRTRSRRRHGAGRGPRAPRAGATISDTERRDGHGVRLPQLPAPCSRARTRGNERSP